jgi:hypothetical protein
VNVEGTPQIEAVSIDISVINGQDTFQVLPSKLNLNVAKMAAYSITPPNVAFSLDDIDNNKSYTEAGHWVAKLGS